jgi:PRA1 family protein.
LYRDKINIETLRPLPIFLGITGPSFCIAADAFTPPSKKLDKNTLEKVKQRVGLNTAYFLTNYTLIATGTFVVVVLLHPMMILCSVFVYLLWKVHNVMVNDNIPLVVMGKDIGQYLTVEMRTKILYFLTLWVVVFYCLIPFLLATGLTALMVMTHALLRDPKQIETGRGTVSSYYKDNDSDDDDDVNDDSSGSEVMVEKGGDTV